MRAFVLGLLVSRAARAEGATWPGITEITVALTAPDIDTWGTAANLLGIEVPEGVFA